MTFVDFLRKQGYSASSYIDEFIGKEFVVINEENILMEDVPKTQYAALLRSYHFRKE